jgi:hypothetical protein
LPFRKARTDSHTYHVDGCSKAPLTHKRAPITPWGCQYRWACDYHLVTCNTAVSSCTLRRLVGCKKQRLCPPPPPGSSGANPNTPRIASRHRVGRPGYRAFFLGTRMEEAPHAPPVLGAGAAPPPKPTTPTSQRLTPPSKHTGPGW